MVFWMVFWRQSRLHSVLRLWGWLVGLALFVTACGGGASAPLPDARETLTKAAREIRTSKALKIKLQLTGAPSFVNPPDNTISFISADGAYASPDRIGARIVAKILGVAGEVDVIAIGDIQWFSNKILTGGKFIKQVFSPGFNAAKLISSDSGIESALQAIRELKMVGAETLDGVKVYHLSGVADGKDMEALTIGLIRGKVVNADIYINQNNSHVERVTLLQPDTVTDKEPKPTIWNLEVFDYNDPAIVVNAPPEPSATSAPPLVTTPTLMETKTP